MDFEKYYTLSQSINPETKVMFTTKEVLDEMNMKRYCCRRMLTTNSNVIDQVNDYELAHKNELTSKYIVIHNKYVDKTKRVYLAR
jgi:DNA-directed RNA polymerase subunit N (RpoN/RPB10)